MSPYRIIGHIVLLNYKYRLKNIDHHACMVLLCKLKRVEMQPRSIPWVRG
jgi:hypothetical protein